MGVEECEGQTLDLWVTKDLWPVGHGWPKINFVIIIIKKYNITDCTKKKHSIINIIKPTKDIFSIIEINFQHKSQILLCPVCSTEWCNCLRADRAAAFHPAQRGLQGGGHCEICYNCQRHILYVCELQKLVWLCTLSACLWCNINGKMSRCLRVLERQKRDQTSLSWRQKGLQLRDVWSWGTGGIGTVPAFNLVLRDTGFSVGAHWEGAGCKRECNLRTEAADFSLPFRQPLLGVVWCDHQ